MTRMLRLSKGLPLALGILVLHASAHASQPAETRAAEPPRLYVETKYTPPSGRVVNLRQGDDFQAAIDRARLGDIIVLQAGAVFEGPFVLPKKEGSGWIVIRSSAREKELPPPGMRIDPSYSKVMPKLEAAFGSVVSAAEGAHHYRFIGIEFRPKTSREPASVTSRPIHRLTTTEARGGKRPPFMHNLILLDSGRAAGETPHHIIFDRCYLHGDPGRGARRGIVLNSRHTAIIDSHLSDFKEAGADSQALAGWNGPGPFKIVNNYLEAAGENVLFGGADSAGPDRVPSDIEIRGNHFAKPLTWKVGDPSFDGTAWSVKNLFELKSARRVLVDGNIFEYNWPHAQNGFAILFTVRNQDGAAPWSVIEDVIFTNNAVGHVASGINILGTDNNHPSRRTRRILIRNNLFFDLGPPWGGGQLFQLLDGTADVVIDHNTAFQAAGIVSSGDGAPHTGFVFSNNLVRHNAYGIIGSGEGVGNPTLRRYFPGALIRNNVIVGGSASQYPRGNFFPGSLDNVGFLDWVGGDYRLASSSPFKKTSTEGKDIGADFKSLCRKIAAVRRSATQFRPCSLS